jgi:hypothetical protein
MTALAWSSRTTSPSTTEDWNLELAGASRDYGLHLFTKTSTTSEEVFNFGGGLSGHHGTINGMTFCGGTTEDSARYVATVSDDKMLMVWDLYPDNNVNGTASDRELSVDEDIRPQPTTFPMRFSCPLTSVASHPSTSKELLVADSRGSIFLTDWRSDPDAIGALDRAWHHPSTIELVEPKSLAEAASGGSAPWTGSCSLVWRKDDAQIIGSTHGNRFNIWNLKQVQGGKPLMSGSGFGPFRWNEASPGVFALGSNSPTVGAQVSLYNTSYIYAEPSVRTVAPRPQYIRDFDFLSSNGPTRIAAAVGHEVLVFSIGEAA